MRLAIVSWAGERTEVRTGFAGPYGSGGLRRGGAEAKEREAKREQRTRDGWL